MFDRRAVERDFGRAAKQYEAQAQLQRQVRAQCIELARAYWPDGTGVLDVGSGTDTLHRDCMAMGIGWRITAIDLSPGMCAEARRRQAMVVNAAAEALPFADASFDGVFSSLMLQWTSGPVPALREMHRVLKPGGQCIVSTFIDGTLEELRAAFAAVDGAAHVSAFVPAPMLATSAAHIGFSVHAADEATVVEHYPDAGALMRSLKAIGAANKLSGRRRGLMTPGMLGQVERTYAKSRTKEGLPATWKILFLVMEKQ